MITSRARSLVSLAALAAILLPACGDDSDGASGAPDTTDASGEDTLPPVTTTDGDTTGGDTVPPADSADAAPGFEHPTGADDVVLRIGYYGGFVPVDVSFQSLPTLLVTGDGRLISQGPVIEIYPGPLLPNLQVRAISEAGIQELLAMADEHGLLSDRTYDRPLNIADAPDTVVEISVDGDAFFHQAYALGIGDETDADRAALADFVAEATGEWLYGDNPELGADQPYVSDTFLVRASEVGDVTGDVAPTIVDWPAPATVRLAEASECAEVPASEVDELFESANQLTYFVDGGVTYQLAVKPLLPGDGC